VRQLSRVAGAVDRGLVGGVGVREAAQAAEQVGADRVEQVIPVRPRPSTIASASAGPWTSATATARFSATTGLGATMSSWSYSARIWSQSVAVAIGASLCTALIAAWI